MIRQCNRIVSIIIIFAALWVLKVTAEDRRLSRNIELLYTAVLDEIPPGARVVDLWLPVAQDCDGQKVSRVAISYPEGGRVAVEPKYGNKVWHKRFESPFTNELHGGSLGAEMIFEIQRTEIIVPKAKTLVPLPKVRPDKKTYLDENQLIPVGTEPLEAIARDLRLEADPPIRAARKI